MDIQVASNFERLLYDLLHQDSYKVSETMKKFEKVLKIGRTNAQPADSSFWKSAFSLSRMVVASSRACRAIAIAQLRKHGPPRGSQKSPGGEASATPEPSGPRKGQQRSQIKARGP